MKKSFIIVLAVVSAAALVPQNLAAGVGVKGGLNFANFTVTPATPDMPVFKNLTGLTGGVYFSLNFGYIGFQPEILYSRRGVQWTVDTENIKYELDYVEVPVLVRINVIPKGTIRPVIFGGPSFSYLFKATGKLTSPGLNQTADIKNLFKKTDLAAVFGAGIDFKLPVITVSVDARYHLGLTNVNATIDSGAQTIKNKGITVMVGVGF